MKQTDGMRDFRLGLGLQVQLGLQAMGLRSLLFGGIVLCYCMGLMIKICSASGKNERD